MEELEEVDGLDEASANNQIIRAVQIYSLSIICFSQYLTFGTKFYCVIYITHTYIFLTNPYSNLPIGFK
jgi:hypothetical protein